MRRNRRTGRPIIPTYKITGDSSLASTHLPAAREYLMKANRIFGQHMSFSTSTVLQDGTAIKAVKAGRQFLLFVDAPPVIPPVNVPGGLSWKFLKVPKITINGRYAALPVEVFGHTSELGYQRVTLLPPNFDQGLIPGLLGNLQFGNSLSLSPYYNSTRNVVNVSATSYTTSGVFGTLPTNEEINAVEVGQFDQRIDAPATEDAEGSTHIVSFNFSPGRGIPSAYPIRINDSLDTSTAQEDLVDKIFYPDLQDCGSDVVNVVGVLTPLPGSNKLYRGGKRYSTISDMPLGETEIDTTEHIYEFCLHEPLKFRILGYTRIYDIIVPSEPPVDGEPVTKTYEFVFGYSQSAVIRGIVLSPLIVRYREYVGDNINGNNDGWLQLDPKLIGVPLHRLNEDYPLHNHLFPISFSQSGFKGISTFCDYGWSRFDKDGTGGNGETTDPWTDYKTQRGLESFSTLRIDLSNFNPDQPEYEFSIETEAEYLAKTLTRWLDDDLVEQSIPPADVTYKTCSDFLQGTETEIYIKKRVITTNENTANELPDLTHEELNAGVYKKSGVSATIDAATPFTSWWVWDITIPQVQRLVVMPPGELPPDGDLIRRLAGSSFWKDTSVVWEIHDNRQVPGVRKQSAKVEWIISHPPVVEENLTFDEDDQTPPRWEIPTLPVLLEKDLSEAVEETSLFEYLSVENVSSKVISAIRATFNRNTTPAYTEHRDPTGNNFVERPATGVPGTGVAEVPLPPGSALDPYTDIKVALGIPSTDPFPNRELEVLPTTRSLKTEANLAAVDLRTRHTLFLYSDFDEDYSTSETIYDRVISTHSRLVIDKEPTDLKSVTSYTYMPGKIFAKSVESTEGVDNYNGDRTTDIRFRYPALDLHTGLWGHPGKIIPSRPDAVGSTRYKLTSFRESTLYALGDMYNSPTIHFKPDECTFLNRHRSVAHSIVGMTPSHALTTSPHLAVVPGYDLTATKDGIDPQTGEVTLGAMNPYIDSQGIEGISADFSLDTEESRLEVKDMSTYHGLFNKTVPDTTL